MFKTGVSHVRHRKSFVILSRVYNMIQLFYLYYIIMYAQLRMSFAVLYRTYMGVQIDSEVADGREKRKKKQYTRRKKTPERIKYVILSFVFIDLCDSHSRQTITHNNILWSNILSATVYITRIFMAPLFASHFGSL